MHLPGCLEKPRDEEAPARRRCIRLDDAELEAIMAREFGPVRRPLYRAPEKRETLPDTGLREIGQRYYVVDGYNVIFDWDELHALADRDLSAARERLRYRLGRDPRLSELSEETGLTPEEIASVELATGVPESLQQETAEGLTLESTLGTDSPEESMVERIALREAIDALPEREKMTILLRFFKGLTQEQTARILGVSQVQVSRLERRGLANLRKLLDD
mgnify:FL=1